MCVLIKGFNCAIKKHEDSLFFHSAASTGVFIIRGRSYVSRHMRAAFAWSNSFSFCGIFNTDRNVSELSRAHLEGIWLAPPWKRKNTGAQAASFRSGVGCVTYGWWSSWGGGAAVPFNHHVGQEIG